LRRTRKTITVFFFSKNNGLAKPFTIISVGVGGNVRFYNEIQIFFSKKCNFRYSGRAGKKRVQEKNEIFFTFTSFEYDRFSAKVETLIILPIEVLPTIGLFLCTYLRESSAFKN
jgi:hypothetical protein